MCLTSKHKLKEKFRFFKEGEVCVSQEKNSTLRICFIRVKDEPYF